MSYAAIQALVSGKRPIWRYRIRRGTDISFLTSGSEVLTVGGNVYVPTPVTHSKITQTNRSKASEVRLTFPNSHPVARQFLDMDSLDENTVTIWHGYAGEAEHAVKFRGRVVSRQVSRTKIILVCENNFTALRAKGISAVVQRPCRHALYHGGCRLKLADWQVTRTASAVNGLKVTVGAASGRANGFYQGGVIEFNGAVQMITKHNGSTLTLLGPLVGLEDEISNNGTASVKIAQGCNRSMSDCETKFDNLKNYGGFPWMAGNPFDGRSVY